MHYPHEYVPPRLDAEGKYVDPTQELRVKCVNPCYNWLMEYQACTKRIAGRTDGMGNCQGQYEEFIMCQDHCVGHELFTYLR